MPSKPVATSMMTGKRPYGEQAPVGTPRQQGKKRPAASSSTSKVPSLNLSSVQPSSKDDAMRPSGSNSARELRSKPQQIKPTATAALAGLRDEDKRHAATSRPEAAQASTHSVVPNRLKLSPRSAGASVRSDASNDTILSKFSMPSVDAYSGPNGCWSEPQASNNRRGQIKVDYLAMAAAHKQAHVAENSNGDIKVDDVARPSEAVQRGIVDDLPACPAVPRMVPGLRVLPTATSSLTSCVDFLNRIRDQPNSEYLAKAFAVRDQELQVASLDPQTPRGDRGDKSIRAGNHTSRLNENGRLDSDAV